MSRALLALLLLFFALPAYAQDFSIPGADTALSFNLSPRFPQPGQDVQLSIQSYLYDLDRSTVTWSVDGKVVTAGEGKNSVTVKAGALGSSQRITVDIAGPTGQVSAATTIAPASVDLLWEADTYAPPFYPGRSLPSAGASIRVAAVPHFVKGNGTPVALSDIVFTWKKDGQVIDAASGRGKSSAVIDGPTLFGSETIVLDAVTADGSLAAESVLRISDTRPQLLLYKNHPLFGILFGQALGSSTFVPDNEMTFAAVPLFAPVGSSVDKNLEYSWRVNQSPVTADSAHADEITINAASSSGLALINLSLTHASNFFFSVNNSWQVTLNSRGSVADPFR